MATLRDWLDDHVKTIRDGIIEGRGYKHYFDHVFESSDRFYIFKPEGRPTIVTRDRATIIEMPPIRSYDVEPAKIEIGIRNDWRQKFTDNIIMIFGRLIADIRKMENKFVIDTFTKDTREVELKPDLSNLDDVQRIIESNHGYPDTMLVNFMKIRDLRRLQDFIPYYNLPEYYVKQKGERHFQGMLGHISVYGSTGLSREEGVLYSKRESLLKMTPLDVGFDSYENPKVLHINEQLYAWPEYDGIVVKLKF